MHESTTNRMTHKKKAKKSESCNIRAEKYMYTLQSESHLHVFKLMLAISYRYIRSEVLGDRRCSTDSNHSLLLFSHFMVLCCGCHNHFYV